MAKASTLGTRVLEHCVSGVWMRSPMPQCGSAGAAVLSRGFAVVSRVSTELPGRLHLAETSGNPKQVSPPALTCPGGIGSGFGIVLAQGVSIL